MGLKNMKIGTKLLGGFLLVELLVAAAGIVCIIMIGVIGNQMHMVLDEKVPYDDEQLKRKENLL